MNIDPKAIEAYTKAATLVFSAVSGIAGASWAVIKYFSQKHTEQEEKFEIEKQRIEQQRIDEDGRKFERIATLFSEFNKTDDPEKKAWTILALSLYPKETGKLLAISLGRLDDTSSKAAMLALLSIGSEALHELVLLNRMAQAAQVPSNNPALVGTDVLDSKMLLQRTKTVIQNLVLMSDGKSTAAFILADVDLSYSRFDCLHLKGANFRKCDLSYSSLKRVKIIDGNFRGTVFNNAIATESELIKCDITGISGPISAIGASIRSCSGEGVKLANSNLSGSHLEDTNIHDGDLSNSDLSGFTVKSCDFSRVRLNNSKANKSHWKKVRFNNTSLIALAATSCEIVECVFQDCELMGIQSSRAQLLRSVFCQSNLCGAKFKSSSFLGCRFDSCQFNGADFTECDFTGATFINCTIGTGKFDFDIPQIPNVAYTHEQA